MTPSFAPGDLVRARGREWVALPSPREGVLALRPLSGSETDSVIMDPALELLPVEPARFDLPADASITVQAKAALLADALRLTLRRGAGPFRSSAQLAFEPRVYQLVPLLMALRLQVPRLLIADDVGIGKTIEAGLILRELMDRGEVDSFSVLCPPHLVEQWVLELRSRFGIEAVPVTSGTAARLERGLPLAQTLFDAYPHTVVSLDYIKAEKRREGFARACPDFVIVDEAHVLGNPPWERVKLQEQEFFALRDAEIATAKNAAARKKLIERLDETNPRLAREWQDALRTAATESHFMRESGRFPRGGVGDVNTYAVFTDLAWQAVHPLGRAGLIIPNGLVVGFTYREFLRQLLSEKSLVSFYGFENEDKIFKDVHNETKFGLLTVCGTQVNIEQPWFTAHIRQPAEIADRAKRYALTVDEIRAINPNTLNLPAFRWSRDAKVTAAIHTAAPILIEKEGSQVIRNDWKVSLKTMFHMANDSGHFIDHEDVAPLIKERRGALAVLRDGRQVYPLYEGKMFWHFDHRYGTYEDQTEKQANKGVLPRVTNEQHADPDYQIQPRYWIDASLTEAALSEVASHGWYFTWRDLGPSERSLVGTLIPRTAAGNKAPLMICDHSPAERVILATVLSSLVADYAVRQKTNAMTFFVMEQAAVLSRDSLSEPLTWLGKTASDWLLPRAFELFYTNNELYTLSEDLGRIHPPFVWNAERRSLIQAEIDAAMLHLYRLDREQADWVLDSFTVLRKYEERDHQEFRTKRLVLTAYDAMAKAKASGTAYQTPLSPPPADPSLCHPAPAKEAAQ